MYLRFNIGIIAKTHDKALLWFAFALLAILIPYIREITFKDLKVVIDKIEMASKNLDGATISVMELNNRLCSTRDELIDGYQECLNSLSKEDRDKRVVKLSSLYLKEMGISLSTVKTWLIEAGAAISKLDETMDEEYLAALKKIQKAKGFG